MDEYYIPGLTNDLLSGVQSLPTAQPVQTAAYTDVAPLDLGNWNISTMQGLMNNPAFSTDALNKYIADQAALGNTFVSLNPYASSTSVGPDSINANIWNSYNQFDPNNPWASLGQVFRFNTGAGTVDGSEYNAPVTFGLGQTYILTDASGKNIIGRASTPEEMRKLIELSDANQQTGWNLYKADEKGNYAPGSELFSRSPVDNTLKNVLLAAGTAIGANYLGPFIQGAGGAAPGAIGAAATPLGAGLAAAGVNTAGNLVTGASLGDALQSGALAGLSTAALTGLMGGGGNNAPNPGDIATQAIDNADALIALGVNPDIANQIASGALSNIGSAATGAGGGALASTAGTDVLGNFIQVPGTVAASNIPSSFLSGALGAASGALSDTNYGNQVFDQTPSLETQFDQTFGAPTTVYGVNPPAPELPASGVGAIGGAVAGTLPGQNTIEVLGAKKDPLNVGGIGGGIAGTVPGAGTYYPGQNTIEVSGAKKDPLNVGVSPPVTPTAPTPNLANPNDIVVTAKPTPTKLPSGLESVLATIPSMAALPSTPQPTTTTPSKQLTLEDYLRLAGLLSTTIGAVGSAASNKNNTDISGLIGAKGPLNPVFSAQLPAPNLQPAAPRQMNVDWERYAYGPEQSFFTNVPQGQPNTSKAYTGYAEGGAAGSSHRGSFAVGGPGDGRDDKIPAMLSDGEYVMDAETVAMLGNGSSKAGAKALDKFRVAVRKHKGRNLVKGKFSVNAKKPEQYLKGRK